MQQEPFLVHIARQWGWRAYAIPVLVVLTVVILVDIFSSPQGQGSVAETAQTSASGTGSGKSGPVPAGGYGDQFGVGDLPPGPTFAEKSSGQFDEYTIEQPKVGRGAEKAVTYAVEVESSVDVLCREAGMPSPRRSTPSSPTRAVGRRMSATRSKRSRRIASRRC